MKTFTRTLILILIVYCSCTKENLPAICEDPIDPPEIFFTLPDIPGSYWIYEWVSIDSNGTETPLNYLDSVFVIGDSVVNGQEYIVYHDYFFGTNSPEVILKRDSLGYIVGPDGKVLYAHQNFSDTLQTGSYPSSYSYFDQMTKPDSALTLVAGSFETIQHQRTFYFPNGDPVNVCGDTYFQFVIDYDLLIGEVRQSIGLASSIEQECKFRERRLIDYFIP
ncbi:MAG: hypothetical protein KDC34_12125 [Saprospiraceae bacterium]|nr:hypothetical protein [Saprospiraceae bacterium]